MFIFVFTINVYIALLGLDTPRAGELSHQHEFVILSVQINHKQFKEFFVFRNNWG